MNNNTNKQTLRLNKRTVAKVLSYLLFLPMAVSYSQDFASNSDLQESSLSLSLTPTTVMTINDQQHQVVVNQYGILNKATITQLANASNSISINQDGMSNQAVVEQFGYGNSVNIEQSGNYNRAGVIQEGNANTANIIQAGEQTFVVHQIGNDMVVNITQY